MNGKAKGSQFERDVCKKLSLWISDGKNENLLWRSAMSGGRSTVMNKSGKTNKEQAGDISATGREGHDLIDKFYIECKNYKDLGIDRFLINESCKLGKFWNEACKAAYKNEKQPMLIVKQNFFPELAIIWKSAIKYLLFTKRFPHTEIFSGIRDGEIIISKLDVILDSTKLNNKKAEIIVK
ncbi:MAG TPA: hypothetical protein VNX68_09700 [Nitrosopumilaceae archaeon]|jgi:hypothetical protein|nr:hypothetical protein [Nitrosopumilaceae archaeon]